MSNETLSTSTLSITILVVDDIPSARRIVVRQLQMLGFSQVKEATSVTEAIKIIDETYLGLIISDIHLKDGDGFSLLTHLCKIERSVPALFITSDMDREAFEAAKLQKQRIDFLLKPFSHEVLANKIGSILKP